LLVRKFFTEVIPFHQVQPAPDLLADGEYAFGHRPRVLASDAHDIIAVYLPTGGQVHLNLKQPLYQTQWYDPRTGALTAPASVRDADGFHFQSPPGGGDHPWDWVLVLRAG
jgi:hypothetical protein